MRFRLGDSGFSCGNNSTDDSGSGTGKLAYFRVVSLTVYAVLLFATVLISATGRTTAGEPKQKLNAGLLRGTVLPETKPDTVQATNARWLTALSKAGASNDVVDRLDYSNFRFSLKPAASKPSARKVRLRYASLGPIRLPARKPKELANRSSSRIVKWLAYPGCVPQSLKKVLDVVARRFGSVTVNSTHRSVSHNREVGGAKHSYHLKCQAVDFRIHGDYRATIAFLRTQAQVGGLKHYGGGLFHIDTGPRRTW